MNDIVIPDGMSVEQLFKKKSQAQALALQEECYDYLLSSTASFTQKLDYLKFVTKTGDLEPKQLLTPQGTGFTIKIVLNNAEQVVSGVTLDPIEEEPPSYLAPSTITTDLALLGIHTRWES